MTNDTPVDPPPAAPPVTPEAKAVPSPRAALRGFVAGMVGGLLVVGLAAAGLAAGWPSLEPLLLGDQERRLNAVEDKVADVAARLAAAERHQPPPSTSADLSALAQRVTALEAAARTPANDQTERLAGELSRVKDEVDALRRAMPPEGIILRLAERAESAEKEVRQVAAQRASAQALLLVAGQLRDAVNRGDPYQSELRAARLVTPPEDAPLLDSLAVDATAGIPRKDTLIADFPALANDIVRSAYVPSDGDLWQRAVAKLTGLISIRRIDGQGNAPAAIVARAERNVRAGDLAKAADELAALKDRPAELAAKWIKAAKARAAADRTLSELAASAAAQTAKE
jgi:hypothetical protein